MYVLLSHIVYRFFTHSFFRLYYLTAFSCFSFCITQNVFIGVTILLSLTVFLNLVAETLPQVSDAIPLLGKNVYIFYTIHEISSLVF